MRYQIERTVKEAFKTIRPLPQESFCEPYFPSTRANNLAGIEEGGGVAVIHNLIQKMRETGGMELMEVTDSGVFIIDTPLEVEEPIIIVPTRTFRELGSQVKLDEFIARLEEEVVQGLIPNKDWIEGFYADTQIVEERFRRLYAYARVTALTEDRRAIPVALPEAMKIRVITKGPAATTFVLKRVQKWAWSHLKGQPMFRLIGQPVSEEIINQAIGDLEPNEFVNSGDYKAATDNMRSECSEWAMRALAKKGLFDKDTTELCVRALIGHLLPNPENMFIAETKDEKGTISEKIMILFRKDLEGLPEWEHMAPDLEQQNGQLMGSIISFVILCIVNATIVRWAQEIARGRLLRLSQCGLVNGDDNVFKCNKAGYEAWLLLAEAVGWEISVGKSYLSHDFLTVNSQEYHLAEVVNKFTLIPYVQWVEVKHANMGLILGMGTARGGSSNITPTNIHTFYNEMRRQCPDDWKTRASLKFIGNHRQILAEAGDIPWFFPTWLGGLGLEPISDKSRSLKDRKRAAAILYNYSMLMPRKEPPELSWKLHEKIVKRLPQEESIFHQVKTDLGTQKFEDNYHRLYGMLAVDLLFTSDNLNLLKGKSEKSKSNWVIRHNSRIWSWALEHCAGDALDDWELDGTIRQLYPPIQISHPKALSVGVRNQSLQDWSEFGDVFPSKFRREKDFKPLNLSA
jgi:hypothetical protein